MTTAAAAIWHDVECGGYDADLRLWEELAEQRGGPMLDLGCGTGRVALHLARRGHRVFALDRDPELLAELAERATDSRHSGLGRNSDAPNEGGVEPVRADARDFKLPEPVALALAPMQLLQLLPGAADRLACLRCIAAALSPSALFAAAIVEEAHSGFNGEQDLVPDTREVDGWVYASLPVETDVDSRRIAIRRLRKVVSPAGELERSDDRVELLRLDAPTLEAEAAGAGFVPAGRREIPPTLDHVGSTVLLLERSG